MAGRHGVPDQERKTHSRDARRRRRRRVQRRDAAQPWLLWLSFRILLALVVLAAAAWSGLLLRRGQGGYWPLIAVAAGALSLLMISLDVRARRRQRKALRVPSVAQLTRPTAPAEAPPRRGSHHKEPGEPAIGSQRSAAPDVPAAYSPQSPQDPQDPQDPPTRVGRHSHRR